MQIIHQAPLAAIGMGAAFTIIYGVADPLAAFAAVQQVEAEGFYMMGDSPEERMDIAQQQAIVKATKAAAEKAGVFVESFSATNKGELTRDEVRAVAASVLQVKEPVKVVPEVVANGQAIRYHAYVVALVDTANVEKFLEKGKTELADAVYRNNTMEEELAKIQREVESLREQYRQAREEEQHRINEQIRRNNAEFEATEWYKKGYAFLIMSWEDIEAYVDKYHPQGLQLSDVAGRTYREAKCYSDVWARECFERAIELNPDFSLAWRELAFTYLNDAPEKAIAPFQKAVSLAPRDTRSWYYLGCAYREKEQYDKALESMRKITEIDPDDQQHWTRTAWSAIAKIYSNQGHRKEANHAYEKVAELYRKELQLAPNDATLWVSLGYTYYDMERYAEALKFFDKALEIDPSHEAAKNWRESTLKRM